MEPSYEGSANCCYLYTAPNTTLAYGLVQPTLGSSQPPLQQHYEQDYNDDIVSIVLDSAAYWEAYYAARSDASMSYAARDIKRMNS